MTSCELKDRRLSTNYDKTKYRPLTSHNTFINQPPNLDPVVKIIEKARSSNNVSPFKNSNNWISRSNINSSSTSCLQHSIKNLKGKEIN